MLKTLYTLLFTLFLFPVAVGYAQTGSITGTVQNATTHIAISGAIVSIVGQSTTTDSTGHFTLSNLNAGSYSVVFSNPGYPSQVIVATLASGSSQVNMGTIGFVGSVEPIGITNKSEPVTAPFGFAFLGILIGLEGKTELVRLRRKRGK